MGTAPIRSTVDLEAAVVPRRRPTVKSECSATRLGYDDRIISPIVAGLVFRARERAIEIKTT